MLNNNVNPTLLFLRSLSVGAYCNFTETDTNISMFNVPRRGGTFVGLLKSDITKVLNLKWWPIWVGFLTSRQYWYDQWKIYIIEPSREKTKHYGFCVMYRHRSACAVRADWSGWHIPSQGDRCTCIEWWFMKQKSTGGDRCLSGLACAACLCWSVSIL